MQFQKIPTLPEWQQASASGFFQIRSTKPKLVRVDNLMARYHQAFDMSKLNILMELKNAIADWAADKIDRHAESKRWEAMQALEDVVLRKLDELDGWGKHRYLQAVCIGYRYPVPDYDPNLAPASDQARQMDETVDVGKSVTELCDAIRKAHTKYQLYSDLNFSKDEDRTKLKIFMGPEFYFRGRYGAYRDIGWVAKILKMMRTETGKPQYADWLFVHGTVIVSTETEEKGVRGMALQNFALVQKGGPKTQEHHDFYVEKEYPSHIDFANPGSWYGPQTPNATVAGATRPAFRPWGGRKDKGQDQEKDVYSKEKKKASELAGGVIFTMDGITFGLEVCRDHYLQRLKHSAEGGKVQIQLIPSCGMDIMGGGISCVSGGIVFNVDGIGSGHVSLLVNGDPTVQPQLDGHTNLVEVFGTAHKGKGEIQVCMPLAIPWPDVCQDVANSLKVRRAVLKGEAPYVPPRPTA